MAMTKRQKYIAEKVEFARVYPVEEALEILKSLPRAKFTESVDAAVNLGVDPRKSDQVVRGASVLPHGRGKTVRVAVFTPEGPNADKAREAGADVVGFEDLAEKVRGGEMNFDVVIATPDAMRIVGALGPILGPRGLMPNPKTGTVTTDVEKAVSQAKSGQVRYRTDKAGIVHCPIGNVDFDAPALKENLAALIADLTKAKPSSSKGVYMKKVTLSTTMGPGLAVDQASL
jgi:large subunit ribosomal protein L1